MKHAPLLALGSIVYSSRQRIGKASNSPALVEDVRVYCEALCDLWPGSFKHKMIFPFPSRSELQKTALVLRCCNILLMHETLPSLQVLRMIAINKRAGIHKFIVWIPNLECVRLSKAQTKLGKQIIDLVILKSDGLAKHARRRLAPSLCSTSKSSQNCISIAHAFSRRKIAQIKKLAKTARPQDRRTIVHFAGMSPFKNTVECFHAGMQLLRQHPEIGDSLTVQLIKAPLTRRKMSRIYLRIMLARRKAPAELRKRIIVHYTPYISENKKAALLRTARLALCASNVEGFGQYILEAAGYGCSVVTTDAHPMNEILGRHVALAKPAHSKQYRLGMWHTIKRNQIFLAGVRAARQGARNARSSTGMRILANRNAKFRQQVRRKLLPLLTAALANSSSS